MRALLLLTVLLAGCASPAPRGTDAADAPVSLLLVGKGGDVETSLAVGADGTLLVCSHGGFTQAPPVWASRDGGASFARVDTTERASGGDCDVAVGRDGGWHEVYTASVWTTVAGVGASHLELRLASSHDGGRSWHVRAPLTGTELQDRPWLTTSGEDIVDLTYLPSRPRGFACPLVVCNSADSVVFARSTDGGRTWGDPVLAHADPSFPSVAVNGRPVASEDGRVVGIPLQLILSANNAQRRIAYAHSEDGGARWSTSVVVAEPSTLATFPSAAASPDGRNVTVAYAFGTRASATVAISRSADGGRTWSEPIPVATDATFDPRHSGAGNLASVGVGVDASGTATVAWIETSNPSGSEPVYALRVAKVDAGGAVRPVDVPVAPSAGPWIYEFLSVRTAADGDALVVYPWNEPGCADTPPEAEGEGRNQQCVQLLRVPP